MRRALLIALTALTLPGGALAQQASTGRAADLRVLDKVTGQVSDLTLAGGESQSYGHLRIRLNECRYPTNNPSGDAYAALTVTYRDEAAPVFSGWMIASAPALNAMDHPRYDVWVLRCSDS